jgi:hypothetical protein
MNATQQLIDYINESDLGDGDYAQELAVLSGVEISVVDKIIKAAQALFFDDAPKECMDELAACLTELETLEKKVAR